MKKLFVLIFSIVSFQAYASFTNQKGDTFRFSIEQYTLSSPAPSVIVSHGGACLTSFEHSWAKTLNSWGYNAIVIDHCTSRNIGRHTGVEPPPLNVHDRVSDYAVVAEWLQSQNFHKGKIALLGQSRGGEGVIRASDPRFNRTYGGDETLSFISAFIAYYPPCNAPLVSSSAPVLIHLGDQDNLAIFTWCSYENWTNDRIRLSVFKGVSHAFDQPGSTLNGSSKYLGNFIVRKYDHEAATKSQQITRDFLNETLKGIK
jgi:dienelactone hydrolase